MRFVNILQDDSVMIKDRDSHTKQIAKVIYVMGVRMQGSKSSSEASEIATEYAVDVSSLRLRELLSILVKDGYIKEEEVNEVLAKLGDQLIKDTAKVTEEYENLLRSSEQLKKALNDINNAIPPTKIN